MGKLFKLLTLCWVISDMMSNFLFSWRLFLPGKTPSTIWLLCLHAMIWAIWEERNRGVFENRSGDPSLVWESFLFLVVSWAKKYISLSCFSFEYTGWECIFFLFDKFSNENKNAVPRSY